MPSTVTVTVQLLDHEGRLVGQYAGEWPGKIEVPVKAGNVVTRYQVTRIDTGAVLHDVGIVSQAFQHDGTITVSAPEGTPVDKSPEDVYLYGLIALVRVVTSDAIWAPAEEAEGPQLSEHHQMIVDELHRMAQMHEGKRSVSMALDVIRMNGNGAAVDAFLADEYEAALDEDAQREIEAWDAYWTGADDAEPPVDQVEQFGVDQPVRTDTTEEN